MAVWKYPITLDEVNARGANTMVSYLDILFTEIGEESLSARMAVDNRTVQPDRILHGGASCVLAETVGSVAANYCVDQSTHHCVGVEINTSHIRPVRSGWITGTAKPLHIGQTTQVWEIEIRDDEGKLVSVTRLRMATLERKPKKDSAS